MSNKSKSKNLGQSDGSDSAQKSAKSKAKKSQNPKKEFDNTELKKAMDSILAPEKVKPQIGSKPIIVRNAPNSDPTILPRKSTPTLNDKELDRDKNAVQIDENNEELE